MDLVSALERLNEYGAPGLFLAAFISNLIPGFPAFYLAFIGTYAAVVDDPAGGALAVAAAGVGAGLGKVAVFLASRGLTGASERLRRKREEARWIIERARGRLFILVVLVAALPLPDDVLYIPLGATGYGTLAFTVAVIIGKTAQTALAYMLGRAYKGVFERFFGAASNPENANLLVAGAFAGAVIVTAVIFAIDWRRIYDAYNSGGALGGFKAFILELVRVLTLGLVKK